MLKKIEYNSPVVLTFSLLAVLVFALDKILPVNIIENLFIYYGRFSFLDILRLFLWPLGHGSYEHLAGNLTILLLIGPMIEKKYSSRTVLILILVSALVIGLIQGVVFHTGILGASGIVFMFIVLTSFTSDNKSKIPLTFIVIAVIYLGREVINGIFVNNNVSELGHILGAGIGIVYDRFIHKG